MHSKQSFNRFMIGFYNILIFLNKLIQKLTCSENYYSLIDIFSNYISSNVRLISFTMMKTIILNNFQTFYNINV